MRWRRRSSPPATRSQRRGDGRGGANLIHRRLDLDEAGVAEEAWVRSGVEEPRRRGDGGVVQEVRGWGLGGGVDRSRGYQTLAGLACRPVKDASPDQRCAQVTAQARPVCTRLILVRLANGSCRPMILCTVPCSGRSTRPI